MWFEIYLWGTPPPPPEAWPAGALCPIELPMELPIELLRGALYPPEGLRAPPNPCDDRAAGVAENAGAGRT